MDQPARLVNGSREPNARQVAAWIGNRNYKRWTDLTQFIEGHYPRVFNSTWLFGGAKYGWSLRFKKSKSFCTLIPEKGKFRILLVFGAEERKKVEILLPRLASHVAEDYEKSTTYHDGRWVWVNVDSKNVLNDVERLLVLKRPTKLGGKPEPV